MKRKTDIRTLCPKCRADYESSGNYYVQRVDPMQITKEKCDYCSFRVGYNYELITKKRGNR